MEGKEGLPWSHDVGHLSWWLSAIALFESIDRALFEKCNRDPNKMLAMLSAQKFDELSQNEEFLKTLRSVMDKFDAYMNSLDEHGQ